MSATALVKALQYMGLTAGKKLAGTPVDVVFFGSCTNSRISDLRDAAEVLRGRHVAPNVRVLVVPGSQQVKRQAEAEGLDVIFKRSRGRVARGRLLDVHRDERRPAPSGAATPCRTSNRNFEGRQGRAVARCSPARSPPPPPPSRA